MASFLFDVQEKNKLQQLGLLRRFTLSCFGHQETVEEMKMEKTNKFNELKEKKNTKEYEEWFLNYRPDKIIKKEIPPKIIKKTLKKKHKRKSKIFGIF